MSDQAELAGCEPLYVIWSNEHRQWWKPGGWGYTDELDQAGRYTRADAIQYCSGPYMLQDGIPQELPVRIADLEAIRWETGPGD